MSRVRRNVSPAPPSKQGPMKAVRAFPLALINSPATANCSRTSERKSPSPPKDKGSKTQLRHSPVQYLSVCPAWRASSADAVSAVGQYLSGQWPKDLHSYQPLHSAGVFMCDKSTQTLDVFEQIAEKKKSKNHRRSASFGQGDLSKEVIKQRLQKTKDSSKLRLSPVTGVHNSSLSLTAPAALLAHIKPFIIPSHPHHPARQSMNRFQRNSVEGLNVEIEKLVLSKPGSSSTGPELEEVEVLRAQDIPDGHRAPIPEVTRLSCTRSVDTQTPSGQREQTQSALNTARPDSVSPAVSAHPPPPTTTATTTTELTADSRSDSLESKSSKGSEYGSPELSKFSPKPEKSCPFVRQPPDGCEKVKVIEDTRKPVLKEPLSFQPPIPFVLMPSQRSAFCPLSKQCQQHRPSSTPLSLPLPPGSSLNHSPTIEGQ